MIIFMQKAGVRIKIMVRVRVSFRVRFWVQSVLRLGLVLVL